MYEILVRLVKMPSFLNSVILKTLKNNKRIYIIPWASEGWYHYDLFSVISWMEESYWVYGSFPIVSVIKIS